MDDAALHGSAASKSFCPGSRSEPAWTSSTASPARRRSWGSFGRVVTIHDVIYRIHPEAHAGWRSLAMRALVPLAARRSDRVIVPSRSTRDDLFTCWSSCREIHLVPNGSELASARWDSEEELRRRYDLGTRPFVLTVSLKRPNKNLLRLLEAMALIPGERRPILVLAGHATPMRLSFVREPPTSVSESTLAFRAGFRARSSRASIGARPASSSHRSTKASDCRSSKQWLAGLRSLARTAVH